MKTGRDVALVPTGGRDPAVKPPSGKEKAALLLATLGPELSADVLKQLSSGLIERVIAEMMSLRRFDAPTVIEVLEEGLIKSGAAAFNGGGIDIARDILTRTLGQQQAEDIMKRLSAQGANLPFQFLRDIDRSQFADFLAGEHPQTVALILSRTTPDLTANMLQRLDPALRAEVTLRIATIEHTPQEVVREVEALIKDRLSGAVQRSTGGAGGVDFLVQVLTRTDRQTERTLLDHLDATVPEVAEQIRAKMFLFEDIAKLDDRTIQRIIRELDLKEMAKALKNAREDMRTAIYRNMSSRAAEMLQDELETMGPMRSDQVSRAQRSIVNVVRRLEEQEEIVINRAGSGENEIV
jgi:flagellar motor switch protein FliG